MKQPLYLGSRAVVRLDDGPSLVVKVVKKIPCRFPLARISRIVMFASTNFSSLVIKACMKAKISMVWRATNGVYLASFNPLSVGETLWTERITDLLSQRGWKNRYRNWLNAQHHLAMVSLARQLRIVYEPRREKEWLNRLFHHYSIRRQWAECLLQMWRTMAISAVIEYWLVLEVPPEIMQIPSRGWKLTEDMADCLALDMLVVLINDADKWRKLRGADKDTVNFMVVQAFERRRKRQMNLLGGLYFRFQRWILECELCR
ncbi:MAG TPA: hypothetical protein ENI62_10275 [Gammaproteobacteria bacterium]|nr:hypothetical protein [Gammaproteobacteria bacterium]